MKKIPGSPWLSIHQVAGMCSMTDEQAAKQVAWAVAIRLMYAHSSFTFDHPNPYRLESFQKLGFRFREFKTRLEDTLSEPNDLRILTPFVLHRRWLIEVINRLDVGERFSFRDLSSRSSITKEDRLRPHLAWAIAKGLVAQDATTAAPKRSDKVFRKLTGANSFDTHEVLTIADPYDETALPFGNRTDE